MMTATFQQPAPLARSDHRHVRKLFSRMPRHHLHLDWLTLGEWLGDPSLRCRVMRQDGSVSALMGATLRVEGIAWLRMILPPGGPEEGQIMARLWEALRNDLAEVGVRQVGILAIEQWVNNAAGRLGFSRTNTVVTMKRDKGPLPQMPAGPLLIREALSPQDVRIAARIDTEAFAPLWRYDFDTLVEAKSQAATFTLLEREEFTIGYQLSTFYGRQGHLARLAVLPSAQGQGYGALLVADMIRFFEERGIKEVSVNTQEDNIPSQRLYKRLGFTFTGYDVPVWVAEI